MVVDIDIVLNSQLVSAVEAQITVIRNHSALENLEYEHSGHTGFASQQYVDEKLEQKVNEEAGKGLSANDFTDEYKSSVEQNKENIADLVSIVSTLELNKADNVEQIELTNMLQEVFD